MSNENLRRSMERARRKRQEEMELRRTALQNGVTADEQRERERAEKQRRRREEHLRDAGFSSEGEFEQEVQRFKRRFGHDG